MGTTFFSHPESHTHLQFARANAQTKNCKRVCLANAQEEMKLVANLKDKMTEIKESQPLTKAIRNAGKVLNMNIVVVNKISSKLKVWSNKIPHYA
jgi:hypothetical protein